MKTAVRTPLLLLLAWALMPGPLPQAFAGHPVGHAPFTVFKSMDVDNDGQLTREEYLAGSRRLFADLDTDGDGRVTAAEMAAIYTKSGELPAEMSDAAITAMAAETIRASDRDGDGRLTATEHAAGDEAMFAKLDQNKDGWLSQSECEAGKETLKKEKA